MTYAKRIGQALLMLAVMALPVRAIEVQTGPAYTVESGKLKVTFKPIKETFAVGDTIQFELTATEDMYLYLLYLDKNEKVEQVLLPRSGQKEIRYKKEETVRIPDPQSKVTVVANTPGVERFQMIASTKKLDVDWLNAGAAKALFGLIGGKKEQAQLRLDIKVNDRESPSQAVATGSASDPATFVTTARQTYKLGDKVKILYGADQPGQVTLFLVDGAGKREQVHKQQVNGKSYYKLEARASAPIGDHQLIAEFAPEPQKAKGLQMVTPGTSGASRAVYRFKVVE